MLVEHSFVTTLEAVDALSRIQQLVEGLGFTVEECDEHQLSARRGERTAARAKSLEELPQHLKIGFDRGRIDLAISLEVRRRALDLHRDLLLGIARALESSVVSGLKTEQAVELLVELQRELGHQATRRKIRSWILAVGLFLLAIGALVAVALLAG